MAQAVATHLTAFGAVSPMPPLLFRLRSSRVAVGGHRRLLGPSSVRAIERDSPLGRVIDRQPAYDVVEFDAVVVAEWLRTDPRNK